MIRFYDGGNCTMQVRQIEQLLPTFGFFYRYKFSQFLKKCFNCFHTFFRFNLALAIADNIICVRELSGMSSALHTLAGALPLLAPELQRLGARRKVSKPKGKKSRRASARQENRSAMAWQRQSIDTRVWLKLWFWTEWSESSADPTENAGATSCRVQAVSRGRSSVRRPEAVAAADHLWMSGADYRPQSAPSSPTMNG